MCGICGFARHPNSENLGESIDIFEDMMLSIEKRGRHATGIAVDGSDTPIVWKSATTASAVLKSEPWKKIIDGINVNDTIIMGHTRHASIPNSTLDEAAHPFHIGEIIGAHNGMIFNWKEIEREIKPKESFIVDSQAIFALLDVAKKPISALEQLEGYFALEWTRRKQLYLARSASGMLAAAYVYQQRTLYWHSEGETLRRILRNAKLKESKKEGDDGDFKIWVTNPDTVYRYNPTKFTETSAHAEKYTGNFSAKRRGENVRSTQVQIPFSPVMKPVTEQSRNYLDKDYEPSYVRRLRIRVEELERQVDSIFSFLESKGMLDDYEESSTEAPEADFEIEECEYCGQSIEKFHPTVDGTNGGRIHAWHLRTLPSGETANVQ